MVHTNFQRFLVCRKNMPNGTKLRFALITEEALEKLRPNPEPSIPIRSAVKEVLSEVMAELNLNQMIEDKLVELLERRGIVSSQSPSESRSLGGLAIAKKTSILGMPLRGSLSSVSTRTSVVRRQRKGLRTKSQTIFPQPTHREVTFSLQDTTSMQPGAAREAHRDSASPHREAVATKRVSDAMYRDMDSKQRRAESKYHSYRKFLSFDQQQRQQHEHVRRKSQRQKLHQS
ncbi:uncharacterized protein LOC117580828 [Drosophila guanche]|uniref:Uncharacterized protein n=1 Tax=Drosophila guanche TaxID=7266 RepID=A0A3B0K060_DROGU|nr:uncharacterized protein LOC117580828 [Drosophila guanche]SPP78391.1 Hypothetical predicted protein [Drosophila guanche]